MGMVGSRSETTTIIPLIEIKHGNYNFDPDSLKAISKEYRILCKAGYLTDMQHIQSQHLSRAEVDAQQHT